MTLEIVVSVKFHCGKCGKLIRAPKEASGGRGKCPYCKQSVYIPSAEEEREAIPLAPIDEDGDRQQERLDREAKRFFADLSRADGDSDIGGGPSASAAGPPAAGADVHRLVIEAVQALQESDLGQADELIRRLKPSAEKSKAYIQALMVDEMRPPELEACPSALYKGFLRTILEQL
ncbi:MAG: hypothetical protein JSV19_07125 [Phycisphaerales bacterium]|nr:MAG: hypothetical protein JSV19_07125 [Phycisphaerales bacterium]